MIKKIQELCSTFSASNSIAVFHTRYISLVLIHFLFLSTAQVRTQSPMLQLQTEGFKPLAPVIQHQQPSIPASILRFSSASAPFSTSQSMSFFKQSSQLYILTTMLEILQSLNINSLRSNFASEEDHAHKYIEVTGTVSPCGCLRDKNQRLGLSDVLSSVQWR